jgi:hypothetical protein
VADQAQNALQLSLDFTVPRLHGGGEIVICSPGSRLNSSSASEITELACTRSITQAGRMPCATPWRKDIRTAGS